MSLKGRLAMTATCNARDALDARLRQDRDGERLHRLQRRKRRNSQNRFVPKLYSYLDETQRRIEELNQTHLRLSRLKDAITKKKMEMDISVCASLPFSKTIPTPKSHLHRRKP